MIRYFKSGSSDNPEHTFTAVSDKEDSRPWWIEDENEKAYPRAQVIIRRPYSEPNFIPTLGGLKPDPLHVPRGHSPETLFTSYPAEIESAFSHTSMRHAIPTLLGLAKNEYHVLQAPWNLSKHSSRLVKKGLSMRALLPNPENPLAVVHNWSDFEDANNLSYKSQLESKYSNVGPEKQVSNAELHEARHAIRTMLRPDKKQTHMGPQFEHPQLPDVEW